MRISSFVADLSTLDFLWPSHFGIKVQVAVTELKGHYCFDWLLNSFEDALEVIVNCFIYRNGLCSVVVSSELPYGLLICHQMGNQSLETNFHELIKQL